MRTAKDIQQKEIVDLLNKCWMTHDGMWFFHCLQENGIEITNRINKLMFLKHFLIILFLPAIFNGCTKHFANKEVPRATKRVLNLIDWDFKKDWPVNLDGEWEFYFKAVNDTYGHEAGDVVLKTFAKTVKNNIRKIDVFGRLGGEEFSLLLAEN